MKLNLTLIALVAAAAAVPAQAGLDGTTVSGVYYFPDDATPYGNATFSPGSFVVGAGVESTVNVEDVTFITVDFTDNGLSLFFNTVYYDPTWTDVSFNGLVFTGTGFQTVTGLSILPGSTFGASNPGQLNFSLVGDQLRLDWGGVNYHAGEVLHLAFPDLHGDPGVVPEPATWAMLIAGFGLVGASLRRRRPLSA